MIYYNGIPLNASAQVNLGGGGNITVDQKFNPESSNPQSGTAVEEAVGAVKSQIPLTTLYTLEFGKPIAVGEINEFKFIAFNRTPVVGERFFAYCIEKDTNKSFHISAVVRELKEATETTEATAVFEITEAIQCGGTSASSVPDYVLAEAEEVADQILAKRNADSFVMALASDLHTDGGYNQSSASVLHASQGIDTIASLTQLDLVALLGDYPIHRVDDGTVNGGDATDTEDARKSIKYIKKVFSDVAHGVPFMMLKGNHENLTTGYEGDMAQIDYAYIGANNVGVETDYANKHRIYGYRDFENYKIRVIYLNTADVIDNRANDEDISQGQLTWLKNVALNLTDTDWGIVVLSHHPLKWWRGMDALLAVLDEYKGKGEGAELIAHFHGHLHNFRAEKLGTNGVLSITIPNACFIGNNDNGNEEYHVPEWIEKYGDAVDGVQKFHNKTADTAEDTAFNVVVIDRKSKTIHCLNYGAGRDRELSYADEPETPRYINIIDTIGCENDTRFSTADGSLRSEAGYCTTGLIPITDRFNDVIAARGLNFAYDATTNPRATFCIYNKDGSYVNAGNITAKSFNENLMSIELDDDGMSIKSFVLRENGVDGGFIRLCGKGTGENLIVTINEPIE